MKKKIIALSLTLLMLFALAACGKTNNTPASSAPVQTAGPETPAITEDRQGNPITLPEKIETIMTFGPSNADVLSGLGIADKIIAVDTYTFNVEGLADDLPKFEMSDPDVEQIISMKPDIIIVTGMAQVREEDPYKLIRDAGICVIYVPSSESIEAIKVDIRYLAALTGTEDKGEELIEDMEQRIAAIETIGNTITENRSVYFEISAAPYMYSFGSGTFLNEMIDIIGATNVFADRQSWMSVADEAILDLNPDVILTSVNYGVGDPTDEIKSRPGWDAITAVQNDAVHYINTDASNRPCQNVVIALEEMARAIYPEFYS